MKLLKIAAVCTLLFSSISPTIVHAVEITEASVVESVPQSAEEPETPVETSGSVVPEPAEPVSEPLTEEPVVPEPANEAPMTEEPDMSVPTESQSELALAPSNRLFLDDNLRRELSNNGWARYRSIVQSAINAQKSSWAPLGGAVGSVQDYSFTIPRSFTIEGNGGDWITVIAGEGRIPNVNARYMDYGHTSHSRSYYRITPTFSNTTGDISFSNVSATQVGSNQRISFRVTRLRASDQTEYQVDFRVDPLEMGTVVRSIYPHLDPDTFVEGVRYSGSQLMLFTIPTSPNSYELRVSDPGPFSLGQRTAASPVATSSINSIYYHRFVNVLRNGVPLATSQYTVVAPDRTLDTVGTHQIPITVQINDGTILTQDITIEVTYTDGDTIVFGNNDNYAPVAGAYRRRGPRIEAFAGEGADVYDVVGMGFEEQTYYGLSIYGIDSNVLLNNLSGTTTKITHQIPGGRFKDAGLRDWNNRDHTLAVGDLVVAYHAQGKIWLSQQGQRPDYSGNAHTEYFETLLNGFRQLELHKLSVSEHEIPNGMTKEELDQNVANYIDVGTSGRVTVKGFVSYPDTTTNGKKNGVIQVEETLDSGKTATYNYTVPFLVTDRLVVTPKEDINVSLGTDLSTRLKQFIEVQLNGEILAPEDYDAELVGTVSTTRVGRQTIRINVTPKNASVSQIVSVPVTVVWGDSIVFGGSFLMVTSTVAAFTLHHGMTPSISASFGRGTTNFVNTQFMNQRYYDFSWFDMTNVADDAIDLMTASPTRSVEAYGQEQSSVPLARWTPQNVSYGDVVRGWVADPDKNALAENEQLVVKGSEAYYEIMSSGYRLLEINRLTPATPTIPRGSSQEYLDSQIMEYLNILETDGVRSLRFISYPDTSKAGTSIGKIQVEEPLSTGKVVRYTYDVTFNIEIPNEAPTADPVDQELNLGEELPAAAMDVLKNVKDDNDAPAALKATYVTVPDMSTVGQKTARVQLEDTEGATTIIDVPVSIKWGSTIRLGGLGSHVTGAYSLTKNTNGQLQINSTFGESSTNPASSVHPYFGSNVYYSIEILDGETSKYKHEVIGNALIRDAVNGFNQGNPFVVTAGDIVKVYHAESASRSRLMENENPVSYSFGTNYSYYRVTDTRLVPVKQLEAEAVSQELHLGEDIDKDDLAEWVTNVKVNGAIVNADEYEVELGAPIDTSVINSGQVPAEIRTKDGLGVIQTTIPYEVKWGSTIVARTEAMNATASAVSLLDEGGKPKLVATRGDGFSTGNQVTARPVLQIFTGQDLTAPAKMVSFVTVNQTPTAMMNRWNTELAEMNGQMDYGNVLSFNVRRFSNNTQYNGANTWVSRNNQLVKETEGVPTAYYEMARSGLNLLYINQLEVKSQTINKGMTVAALDQQVANYLSTEGFPTIRVTKFIQHPDTSKTGTSEGIIQVEEDLVSGGKATYNYTVPFTVEDPTESIDIKIPKKILFGTSDVNQGNVSSPTYYIHNMGEKEVKVSVKEVTITNNPNNLQLLRSTDADPTGETRAVKLHQNYRTQGRSVDLHESTRNQVVAQLAPDQQSLFEIEGRYFGDYQQEINLGLDIHYQFEVVS
ncbi:MULTISPECIES: Rib/alpha-like domain-containing protein [unclassified Enterococcus]|uniref:Rib/alpha-like domain-containing protein n=1 Tax=unclassified Enterococcus TaxID=2608891 RepID=UPI0013ECACFE|nr:MULTISPECIES: Rib/alpha-like domain-containing protein [unclassified Enterococcus]